MALTKDSVILIDWLNLSIKLKAHGREFGPSVARKLLSIARRESDECGVHLARAHFVAESFGEGVEKVIDQDLTAQAHRTRTAKEQADLMLAVLAMDHLHQVGGSPGMFIIATGDQDFVPLVERLIEEKATVVLVAGSLSDLAAEYRSIVTQHKVKLIGLVETENVPLLRMSKNLDEAAVGVAALVRLIFDGGMLGGDQARNLSKIKTLRIGGVAGGDEELLQSWIREFGGSEMRRVAVPGKRPSGNQPATRRRTFIDFGKSGVATSLADMDWILRRCDPASTPPTRGSLGVGRFVVDDGSRVGAAVSALTKVGWLQERPNGVLDNSFPWGSDGFVEPLLRLIATAQSACYQDEVDGIERDRLWKGLASVPLGANASRKSGGAAAELIDFGRRLGVIDAYPTPEGGFVLGVVGGHALVKQSSACIRLLKEVLPRQEWVAEHELLNAVRDAERTAVEPLFGFDTKDRRSVLRPLVRANVLARKPLEGELQLRLRDTAWVAHV